MSKIPTMEEMKMAKFAYDAVHNPMSVFHGDPEAKLKNTAPAEISSHSQADNSTIDATQDEIDVLEGWAKRLRMVYIGIASFMIATALMSLISISLSTVFIALYILMFACLICCYECAYAQAVHFIVQNFGFLYNTPGRFSYLIFVAVMSYSLGIMGIVCFALLLATSFLDMYVCIKYPKFVVYMRKKHFYSKVTPGLRN